MKLRLWQQECIRSALDKFESGQRHFLCLATPGAGKSLMAASLAKRLFEQQQIDFVLCFSPSLVVAQSLLVTFERVLHGGFEGQLGDLGTSLTYQAMLNLPDKFWSLLKKFRVLVVFDEIHHCAGDEHDFNAWGQVILHRIQNHACFTLALTGTPWRTDQLRIVISKYSYPDGTIMVDYMYGLLPAIRDKVCRIPNIVLVDNNRITVKKGALSENYTSVANALSSGEIRFKQMLFNSDVQRFMLGQAVQKLVAIRKEHPDAGGLVVAANIAHAHQLAMFLRSHFQQESAVVTYNEQDAPRTIAAFKSATIPWIVSVSMITEGTDIPRLRVCCLLSLARTELFFRQVLGRVLRCQPHIHNDSAWLYCLAEPGLVKYAEQLEQEIPDQKVTSRLNANIELIASIPAMPNERVKEVEHTKTYRDPFDLQIDDNFPTLEMSTRNDKEEQLLSVWMKGKFTERVLALIG